GPAAHKPMSKPDNDATALRVFLPAASSPSAVKTYESIEIVAVNDGSSDATSKVLDAAAARDSRIKAIHLRENVGVHRARTIGFEASARDYIGFVDADDWIDPDMLETMVDHVITENADIVICGANMVDSNGV